MLILTWIILIAIIVAPLTSAEKSQNFSTQFNDASISLAYGSLLNVNCSTNDDCILKNSVCNALNKRCECDLNTVETQNRCQILRCTATDECLAHYDNTICLFGTCKCKYGLKANGKCVKIEVETIKQLPDWAISLIAVGALFGGIFGGRSQFLSQTARQILSLMLMVAGQFVRFQATRSVSGNVVNQVTQVVEGLPNLSSLAESATQPAEKMVNSTSRLGQSVLSKVGLSPGPSTSFPPAQVQ